MFRSNMQQLFSSRSDVRGRLVWTPGHGGLDHMTLTDKNAKAAANSTSGRYLLPLFVSRFTALSEIESLALREWHDHLNLLEGTKQKIFRKDSGFYPFSGNRHSSTFVQRKPAKWFKTITHSLMS